MNAKDLLAKIGNNLSVGRSFGTAYEKDGLYIIPVALVAGGGGGGEGPTGAASTFSDTDSSEEDFEDSPNGSGAGFGGVVVPVGAYVVKDQEVRWVPAVNTTLLALAGLGVIRLIIRSSTKVRKRHHH
jgi:uncharacterized spore protein YtfJ